MKSLTFWIEGKPAPKGRPRTFVQHGRVYTRTPDRTKAWEQRVGIFARAASRGVVLLGPLAVAVDVHGAPKLADLDNLAKAILDGMQGAAIENDRQVVDLHVRRVDDGAEGARVTVTRLGP